jgi:hypothetical protein
MQNLLNFRHNMLLPACKAGTKRIIFFYCSLRWPAANACPTLNRPIKTALARATLRVVCTIHRAFAFSQISRSQRVWHLPALNKKSSQQNNF